MSALPLQHASMLSPGLHPDVADNDAASMEARPGASPPAGGLAAAITPNPGVVRLFRASAARRSGIGYGMSAGLGQAQLVGSMSVPPTWQVDTY